MGIADHIGDGSEITTAIHEMGHMFGAKDHYGIDCPSTADMNKGSSLTYSSSCIYGEVGVEITDPEKLSVCDGCKKTINENRWWYCD